MGCFLSVEEENTSCSSVFGSCKSGSCKSSCMTEAREIEDIIDAKLKDMLKNHHEQLEAQMGKVLSNLVEQGLIKIIDYDIFPKKLNDTITNTSQVQLQVQEEGKSSI
jgi:hypothetical protein